MSGARFLRVWGHPLWHAGVTMFGLLAALLGTGAWHWAAWVALSVPLATAACHASRWRGEPARD